MYSHHTTLSHHFFLKNAIIPICFPCGAAFPPFFLAGALDALGFASLIGEVFDFFAAGVALTGDAF